MVFSQKLLQAEAGPSRTAWAEGEPRTRVRGIPGLLWDGRNMLAHGCLQIMSAPRGENEKTRHIL